MRSKKIYNNITMKDERQRQIKKKETMQQLYDKLNDHPLTSIANLDIYYDADDGWQPEIIVEPPKSFGGGFVLDIKDGITTSTSYTLSFYEEDEERIGVWADRFEFAEPTAALDKLKEQLITKREAGGKAVCTVDGEYAVINPDDPTIIRVNTNYKPDQVYVHKTNSGRFDFSWVPGVSGDYTIFAKAPADDDRQYIPWGEPVDSNEAPSELQEAKNAAGVATSI